MSTTPEPNFTLLQKTPPFEIRLYPTLTVAEVTLTGGQKNTLRNGFRYLFKYIVGHNTKQQKIPMTAPVVHFRTPHDDQRWVTRFILPSNFTLSEAPTPSNKPVKLAELKPTKYAVIKFSGFSWFFRFQQKKQDLKIFCSNHNIKTLTTPIYAYYNAPWTLPWLRRNEVMLPIIEIGSTNQPYKR